MKRLLFLCTGNSCRSQMAEGWARHLHGEAIDVFSAGIEAHGLNPHAVAAMAEAGVDISTQVSQTLDAVDDTAFDIVVTVCDNAAESCPVFPQREGRPTAVVHRPFDDPPRLARDAASQKEAMAPYRRVRDEIRTYVEQRLLVDLD
jgi:arsenate reductase